MRYNCLNSDRGLRGFLPRCSLNLCGHPGYLSTTVDLCYQSGLWGLTSISPDVLMNHYATPLVHSILSPGTIPPLSCLWTYSISQTYLGMPVEEGILFTEPHPALFPATKRQSTHGDVFNPHMPLLMGSATPNPLPFPSLPFPRRFNRPKTNIHTRAFAI